MTRPFKWTEVTCSKCNQKHEMGSGMTMLAEKKGYVHLLDHCQTCNRKTWSKPFKMPPPMTKEQILQTLEESA